MGEGKQKKSATAKLISQFPICALCSQRPSITRDHIPPKAIFDNSHRPDQLVVPACDVCNRGTSTADLIASIMSRWNVDSHQQEQHDHSRLVPRLRKQCPEVIKEWTRPGFIERKKARQHLEKQGVTVPLGAGLASIGPITIRHLNLFAYKMALGLYFEHVRMPLPNSGVVTAIWRTKEDFAKSGVPKDVLEMLPGYATLRQGQWNTSTDFEYRFSLNKKDGLFGCLARFRTALYVTGFAAEHVDILQNEHRSDDWIRPIDLLKILEEDKFKRRLQ